MKTLLKVLITFAFAALFHALLSLVTSVPFQIAVGLIMGMFLASLHESVVHQYLGHAKTQTREFWKRHPRIFLPLIEGFFLHHIVHHGKTFRDGYLVKFGSSLDFQKVDSWAPEAFYRLFDPADQIYIRRVLPPDKIIKHLHEADYGLGAVSSIKFASTALPLVALTFLVAPPWMALTAALPMLFVYPAMSNSIHRHIMHVPQNGAVSVERNDKNPTKGNNVAVGWLVGTAYMKAVERWHWMHHEYIYCNYNLLVLADFFRGTRRKPSPKDLQKMAREGLVMGTWSWFAHGRRFIAKG